MPPLQRLIHCLGISLIAAVITACGSSGSNANLEDNTPPPGQPAPIAQLSVLAGDLSGPGSVDGPAATASFNSPVAVATDSLGNVYVADRDNHVIRKITADGVVSTIAGRAGVQGSADGAAADARFTAPSGIAVDSAGQIYVSDSATTIRKITTDGQVTTLAGLAGVAGTADGQGSAARFNVPGALTIAANGDIYLVDRNNHTVRMITPTGNVSTVAGRAGTSGNQDGNGSVARFNRPTGLTWDGSGDLLVTDSSNFSIRKVTLTGDVTTVATTTERPGSISLGNGGLVYFTEGNSIRQLAPDASVSTIAGDPNVSGSTDGMGAAASFFGPDGIAVDTAGTIYVADRGNSTIRKVSPTGTVVTWAGTANRPSSADGTGAAAGFNYPSGVAVDPTGLVFVADAGNQTVRKVTPEGHVTTLAGQPGVAGQADGTGGASQFSSPNGIASDAQGVLYVMDSANGRLRKVAPDGTVSTLATGLGYSEGNIATDRDGNVYVADSFGNVIRKVSPAGVVTVVSGTLNVSGHADGPAASATFDRPTSLAIDANGNIYVTEGGNHTVRKITPAGTVSTWVGQAQTPGYQDGVGNAARLNFPTAVVADELGNIYVADGNNNAVRKVDANGVVTTVVGVGTGASGFAPGALPGLLFFPKALALHGRTLYIVMNNGIAVASNLP